MFYSILALFDDFPNWSTIVKSYFSIALFSTVVLMVQLLLSILGFDGADDADVGVDLDAGDGLSGIDGISYFSFRAINAFSCLFGWTGFICSRNHIWSYMSFGLALVAGGLAMIGVAWLMRFFMRMASSGNIKIAHAVGKTGSMYLKINSGESQVGAVNVKIGDALREYKAISEDETEISTGDLVYISSSLGEDTLVVRKMEKPEDWLVKGY